MGMPVIGTVQNIERFTRDDLVAPREVPLRRRTRPSSPRPGTSTSKPSWRWPGSSLQRMPAIGADGMSPRRPAPAPYVGSAMGQRFTQVSQVFVNMAYPLAPARPEEMPAAALATRRVAGGHPVRRRHVGAADRHRPGTAGPGLHGGVEHRKRRRLVQFRRPCGHDPRQARAVDDRDRRRCCASRRSAIDPVHLERAKNQLAVSRVRSSERTYATMERAVEELFVRGMVTSDGRNDLR